jgi:hypothetical protein
MRRELLVLALLAVVVGVAACEQEPVEPVEEPTPALAPPDDGGDEAFVRRLVPLMWGRHPLGVHELEVFIQLIEQSDRATLVRSMTKSAEYHRQWEDVLGDALFVNRIEERSNSRCWSRLAAEEGESHDGAFDPTEPPISGDVAEFVRDHSPTDAGAPPIWTMSDLIRSSLTLDDLSPVWRANLFANLSTDRPPLDEAENLDLRRNFAGVLLSTYLNRTPDCMPCHNSEISVTGHEDPALDRTWEVPGYFELALFGTSGGLPLDDLGAFVRRDGVLQSFEFNQGLGAFDGCDFREEPGCDGCVCEESVCADSPECCTDEWTGACAVECGEYNAEQGNMGVCVPGVPEGFEGCEAVANLPGCDGCACEVEVCELIPLCCERGWHQGCADLCEQRGFCPPEPEPLPEDVPGEKPWGMHYRCGTWTSPADVGPDPYGQTGTFGEAYGETASIWDVEALLHSGVDSLRTGLQVGDDLGVAADQAFGWLLAMQIVDVVWQEAYGSKLTIAHDFPRNREQRDELQAMTERFLSEGWSLRELLVSITTGPWFNPKQPASEATSPYPMPPIFDPWTPDRETEEERQRNGAGEQIGRYPGRVLDKKVSRSLAWIGLPLFPDASNSEEYRVHEDLGFFLKDSTQGFRGTDVQFLAAWEAYFGTCRLDSWEEILNTGSGDDHDEERGGDDDDTADDDDHVGDDDDHIDDDPLEPDWIVELLKAGAGRSGEELVSALKDRLLVDPTIGDDERPLLEAVVGTPLDGPVDEPGLRRACAAFLASPQFLLRGLPTAERRGAEPGFVMPGTSFRDQCELIGPILYEGVACEDSTLTLP